MIENIKCNLIKRVYLVWYAILGRPIIHKMIIYGTVEQKEKNALFIDTDMRWDNDR
jgi:hypothetical protein